MTGVVFVETVRRNMRSMVIWGISFALLAVYSVVAVQNSEMLENYGKLMGQMPGWVLSMVGGGDAAFLATPLGFLGVAFYGWMLLGFAIYGLVAGRAITAVEEDRGIMDVFLSMPIPRWRVIVEKFAAFTVLIIAMLIVSTLALLGTMRVTPLFAGEDYTIRIIESSFNMLPATLLMMAFTVLVGVAFRRLGTATGVASAFLAISYLVDVIGRSVQQADILRTLSFYSYYDSMGVLKNGLAWGNIMGLLAVTVILLLGSLVAFQRRDVGL